MNERRMFFFLLVPLFALASGCTYSVHARPPIYDRNPADKVPVRAAIIISAQAAHEKIPTRNFWVGIAHTWEIESGDALVRYSSSCFDRTFESAIVVADKKAAADDASFALFIEPGLFNVNVSHDFVTTLTLQCSVRDRRDQVLYDATFGGKTQSKGAFTKAFWGGVFTGQSAFEDSFTSAIEDAFGQLAKDINSPANRQKLLPLVESAEKGRK